MLKRFSLVIILAWLFQLTANGQYDSIVQRYQKDFDRFRQTREEKFQKFKSSKDSLFYEYLKREWKSYQVYYSKKQIIPKPVALPPVTDKELLNHRSIEIFPQSDPAEDSIFRTDEIRINDAKIYNGNVNTSILEPVDLRYYSNEDILYLKPEKKIILDKNPNSETIRMFYQFAESSVSLANIILQLNQLRDQYQLNDWAFLQLTHLASKLIFSDPNTQILMAWYVLMDAGIKAKIGYSGNDVFVLIPSADVISNVYYVTVNKEIFYIFNSSLNTIKTEIKLHDGVFPGSRMISLKIQNLPEFKNQKIVHGFSYHDQAFGINLNKALLDFFNDYPSCELGIYFNTPLSRQTINSLDAILKPILKDKTEKEKVALLLKFVQETWQYETDQLQFNKEKYMFPDEVLNYSKSDCEDRAIIFVKLIRQYTSLKTVGLSFPGHVAAAVNLKGITDGTFFHLKGENYVVCDPTIIGASIGFLHAQFNKVEIKPKIIEVY